MKKKKINLLGVALILLIWILDLNGISLDDITAYIDKINNEKINEIIDENPIDVSTIIDSNLKVYFIDVGQADSILIRNNNENMLIDAGNNEDGEKLVKYFKDLGITEFKYVVGTHPHEDHIGGLDNVINEFNIEEVLLPDVYTTTKTFEDVLIALEDKNMSFTVPKTGENLHLGQSTLNVIYTGTDSDDLNNTSIILKLIFGSNSFLLTGDATEEVEKIILNKDIKSDVLKVGHHGSRYSSSSNFLDKVKPKYAIISAGKDNSYNHPHKEVITALEKRQTYIYRTDKLGTILVTSDGTNIDITNFKTDTNG